MIQLVTNENLPIFYKLFSDSVSHDYPSWSLTILDAYLTNYSQHRFAHVFTTTSYIGYLAFEEAEPTGFISFSHPELGVSNCEWLGVTPSHRNKGIGQQLLTAWEQHVISHHGHCITLICEGDNIDFYRNRGFNICGLIPNYCLGIDFYFCFKHLRNDLVSSYGRF